MPRILLNITAIFLLSITAFAQDIKLKDTSIDNVKINRPTPNLQYYLSSYSAITKWYYFGLGINVQINNYIISSIIEKDIDFLENLSTPDEENITGALLLGKEININNNYYFNALVGFGITNGIKKGNLILNGIGGFGNVYDKIRFTTICLPLSLGLGFKHKIFGIGIHFMDNLNKYRSYSELLVLIKLGQLE